MILQQSDDCAQSSTIDITMMMEEQQGAEPQQQQQPKRSKSRGRQHHKKKTSTTSPPPKERNAAEEGGLLLSSNNNSSHHSRHHHHRGKKAHHHATKDNKKDTTKTTTTTTTTRKKSLSPRPVVHRVTRNYRSDGQIALPPPESPMRRRRSSLDHRCFTTSLLSEDEAAPTFKGRRSSMDHGLGAAQQPQVRQRRPKQDKVRESDGSMEPLDQLRPPVAVVSSETVQELFNVSALSGLSLLNDYENSAPPAAPPKPEPQAPLRMASAPSFVVLSNHDDDHAKSTPTISLVKRSDSDPGEGNGTTTVFGETPRRRRRRPQHGDAMPSSRRNDNKPSRCSFSDGCLPLLQVERKKEAHSLEHAVQVTVNQRLASQGLQKQVLQGTLDHLRLKTELLEEERNELRIKMRHLQEVAAAQVSKIQSLETWFRHHLQQQQQQQAPVNTALPPSLQEHS